MRKSLIIILALVAIAYANDVIHHYSHHGHGHGVSSRYFVKSKGHGFGGYGGYEDGLGYGSYGLGYGGYGLGDRSYGLGYGNLDYGGYGRYGYGF